MLLGSVAVVALCTLAACGSSSAPAATTAAAATVPAATTVVETTTTVATADADPSVAVIDEMSDCDTVATIKKISQGELDGATDAYGKKLYDDRVAAATARATELKCPAA